MADLSKNAWATPQKLYDYFNKRFNFGIDICAGEENAKNRFYITKDQNALSCEWNKNADGDQVWDAWCNPPYGRGLIKRFMDKAIEQAWKNGVKTLFLVPNTPEAGWINWDHVAEIYFITNGRIAFINPVSGEAVKGNNKGSMLILINPEHRGKIITHYIPREALL